MRFTKSLVKAVLGMVSALVALLLLFIVWVYPEVHSGIYAVGGLLVFLLGILALLNQRALREAAGTRSVRYGANAAVTIGLVLAIVIVINFLNYNHYYRKDLTSEKAHSLSDQTVKVLKDLKSDVKMTVFVKAQSRDSVKDVLDNYVYFNSKNLKVEYVDPDRDLTRAKAANVKKYGTVILSNGKHETRVEEATEEKLTNALIKLSKDKSTTICFLTGHGEKSIDNTEGEGYSDVKTELGSQSYESKNINLLEEAKIPESCDVLTVLGSNKAFFEKEVVLIKAWLDAGGRALFALDPELRSSADTHHELSALLAEWYIQVNHDLILDPTSRMLGVNASVPIVAIYNKDHPITKDFQITTLFPLASSVELKDGRPGTLQGWWLAKSTPKSYSKNNFKEIATGEVRVDENKDKAGSHTLMVAVEGSRNAKPEAKPESKKDEKSPEKKTRIVVMGTSQVAMNSYARHGANIDLVLNAMSWLANDENLISIRSKEETPQAATLSESEGRYIQLFTMILTPGGILLFALFLWFRRRKL